ncbi:sigma-70 family RNA polymerase sigma factor [bacterium]|nr:sigma-70 family RNA polymerase sigma factor [bacterium]
MKKLFLENAYKIRQIIKNFTGSYDEDLEQEVYIRAYKNIEKYKEQNKFSKWISTITANLCRDYLRSSRYKNSKLQENDEEILNSLKAEKTPEKIYSLKERQKITLNAINSLPSKLKKAIILFEFENMSYEKISKIEKIPIGTVKSRINNARKLLKIKLQFLIGDESL